MHLACDIESGCHVQVSCTTIEIVEFGRCLPIEIRVAATEESSHQTRRSDRTHYKILLRLSCALVDAQHKTTTTTLASFPVTPEAEEDSIGLSYEA